MTTTAAHRLSTVTSAPTFSYAQAAKGQVPSNTTSVSDGQSNSDAISSLTDLNASASIGAGQRGGSVTSDSEDKMVVGSSDASSKADSHLSAFETESKATTVQSADSHPPSPIIISTSTSEITVNGSKEHKASNTDVEINAPETGEAEPPEGLNFDDAESPKERKGKKSKAEEPAKEENLVAAPLPAVNVWEQRSAAQAARSKTAGPSIIPDAQLPKLGDARRISKNATDKATLIPSEASSSKPPFKTQEPRPREAIQPRKSHSKTMRPNDYEGRQQSSPRIPPPVDDAFSWPTPESALTEERRKSAERSDKQTDKEIADDHTNKPRHKTEWVTVPFTPTVQFNTPMSQLSSSTRGRGNRSNAPSTRGGREGGRTSHTAHMSQAEDAMTNGSAKPQGPNTTVRRQRSDSSIRAASLPPSASRKQSATTGGQYSSREARKSIPSAIEDAGSEHFTADDGVPSQYAHGRRPASNTRGHGPAYSSRGDAMGRPPRGNPDYDMPSSGSQPPERKHEAYRVRQSTDQYPKDVSVAGKDHSYGRSERSGRGGYRGRGNSNSTNLHSTFANGQNAQYGGNMNLRNAGQGPYSPPIQAPYGFYYGTAPTRGGRIAGGSRSQSIPNGTPYHGRLGTNMAMQHIPPLQTSTSIYEGASLQTMSAVPYTPYVDQYSVLAMVVMQFDYYFSIDNLCKDIYLRKHMDSQGFVFLTFIAGFKRIQALTQDLSLMRFAGQDSAVVEIIRGDDGIDRLRRQEGWEKWVLNKEERDESTRTDGPTHWHVLQLPRPQPLSPSIITGQQTLSPQAFSPQGQDGIFPAFGDGAHPPSEQHHSANHDKQASESALFAAVPEFAPAKTTSREHELDESQMETTFTDAEVENLNLVFTSRVIDESTVGDVPRLSARTFSNGSLDGQTLPNGVGLEHTLLSRQARDPAKDASQRSQSPHEARSPTSTSIPPVMWVKGQKHQRPLSDENQQESYLHVRFKALEARQASDTTDTHHDMKTLYEFWSHFLCRNFNPTMYHEFRKFALEDADNGTMVGSSNLLAYYDEVLCSRKKTVPDLIARHYVEFVKNEEGRSDRPGLARLRAAWRNGALDMKSRKKIDKLIDQQLRAELES